ncbi:TonB-dependent receptor [Sphingomonas adhaesiva]|uniref:TonB-dependent receptor n=1 Tax=Sphingomonas adhaesiva TaxID=28212 RepID=UPI002FF675C4
MAASTVLVSGMAASGTVQAQLAEGRFIVFDIPAGSLQSSLTAFGGKTGLQIIYSPDAVAGRQSARLSGRLTARDALRRLIDGTGLRARAVSAKVIVLEQAEGALPAALGQSSTLGAVAATDGAPPLSPDEEGSTDIVVTGSSIRGQLPVGSNVRTIRRSEIDRNGFGSVAQVLQSLPGNFGGTATEQSALAGADPTGTNATLSTGVNLRGLGAAATLVLLNGRRIAGAGTLGDFADVSSIPMSVVERVEVLMDGASAIYGSDAVGGVVNVIMKDRFTGLESGGRLGVATRGGLREVQLYQTAGTAWAGGSALLSYEFYDRAPLVAADRRFARSADSRPIGGTDHRYIYSLPGNVLGFSPTGGIEAAFAIPPGQNGTALRAGDFISGSANLEDFQIGAYLAPRQTRHSIYALAHQDIGSAVRVTLEGRFTRRDFDSRSPGYATILEVTAANPWFVSPTGNASDLIGYAFTRELGPIRGSGWSETMGLTGAIDVDVSPRWRLSGFGAYAQSRERGRTDNLPNEAIIAEALGTIADDPSTAYSPARDGFFNPYGDGTANVPAVLAAIGSGFLDARHTNRIFTAHLQADGPLFDLATDALRLAAGVDIRREVFESRLTSFFVTPNPSTGDLVSRSRTITAGFAEIRLPLFGQANAAPGLRRLEFSVAGRIEHYPDFGTTANPKVGANWSPFDGMILRGTYGTSFRAPNLGQLRAPGGVSATILNDAGGAAVRVLQLSGGNPDLEPERARSWTIGADLNPPTLPTVRVSSTLFRTIFDRRIDRPAAMNIQTALSDPDLAPFVRQVAPATNPADRAYVTTLLDDLAGGGTTVAVDSIRSVVDTRFVNTAETDVRGVDLTLGYSARHGTGTVSADTNLTYLFAWRQRTTPASSAIDQRDISGRPAAWRGRTTIGWSSGGFDLLAGINHVGRYRDAVTNARIRSWTTVDARIAWKAGDNAAFAGTTIALIAQNLLDRDPPFYDSPAGVGYDAANADATGRFIALQINKSW